MFSRLTSVALLSWVVGLFGTAATAAPPQDYRPPFHPEELKGPPVGKPNEVLVLATAHLSGLPDTFRVEMVVPLLERLADWRPTVITTENVSGLECDSLRRYPFRYASTAREYCPDTALANRATGLDVPAANAEAERLLAAWPALPSPAQRRHLAGIFLAAGEPGSALVQWLRLPGNERHIGDSLNAEMVAGLEKLQSRRNETQLIAAPLAARLGLERLWSVDDHSADSEAPDPTASGAALSHAWDNPATHARLSETERLNAGLTRPEGLLALYRAYNSAGEPGMAYRSDFGAALVEPSPQAFGRQYLAYWETRNLRMVANIRDVLGRRPGARLLAIVGASHKGYFEAYLNLMHDVRLVDAEVVLR